MNMKRPVYNGVMKRLLGGLKSFLFRFSKGVSLAEWLCLGLVVGTILIKYWPLITHKKEAENYHHLRDYDMNMKDSYYEEGRGRTIFSDFNK